MGLRHIRYRVILLLAHCTLEVVAEAPSDAWCVAGRAVTQHERKRLPMLRRWRGNSFGLPPQSSGPSKQLVQRTAALSAALSAADVNEESDEAEGEHGAKYANLSFPPKSAVSHASMPAVQIKAQVAITPNASEHGRLPALAHWVNSSKYFRTTLHVILHSRLVQLASESMAEKYWILIVFMLGSLVFIVMLWMRSVREELQQIETNQLPCGQKSPIRNSTRLLRDFVPSSRTGPSTPPQQVPTTNDMLARTINWPVQPSQQRSSHVQDPSPRSLAHMFSPRRRSMSGPVSGQPLRRNMACLCPELLVPDRHECYVMFAEIDASATSTRGLLCISDANGMAMLYAAYNILPGYTSGKRLVLTSALDESVLASCEDAEPDATVEPRLKIFDGAEKHQGMLCAGHPDIVVLNSGARLEIRKDTRVGTCATDENGWLLACAAPAQEDGGCRMLRISPKVDVGLVILAILGTDILALALHAKVDYPSPRRSVETVAGGLR